MRRRVRATAVDVPSHATADAGGIVAKHQAATSHESAIETHAAGEASKPNVPEPTGSAEGTTSFVLL